MDGIIVFLLVIISLFVGGLIWLLNIKVGVPEIDEKLPQEELEKRCSELGCISYKSFIEQVKSFTSSSSEAIFVLDLSDPFDSDEQFRYHDLRLYELCSQLNTGLSQDTTKEILQKYKGQFNSIFRVSITDKDSLSIIKYFTELGFMYSKNKTYEEKRDQAGFITQYERTVCYYAWTYKAVEYLNKLETDNNLNHSDEEGAGL